MLSRGIAGAGVSTLQAYNGDWTMHGAIWRMLHRTYDHMRDDRQKSGVQEAQLAPTHHPAHAGKL